MISDNEQAKMTIIDRLCYVIAPMLGAHIFKKYWPVKGSYWNKTHIKSDDVFDMNRVIDEANEFIRIHVQCFSLECIMVILCYFTGYLEPSKCIAYMPISIIMHWYPIMINHYNRIIAKNKIKGLEQLEQFDTEVSINENHVIHISPKSDGSDEYHLSLNYHDISPMLRDKSTAVALREYYYDKIGRDKYDISAFIFMNDVGVRKIYQDFLQGM